MRWQREGLLLLVLGCASGLPLALTASTLSAWLDESGVSLKTIGIFAALATPYALKFLWAPCVDGYRLPWLCCKLGQYRGWVVASQMCLMGSLVVMSMCSPQQRLLLLACAAVAVAFFSATQDIALDALRISMVPASDQGLASAVFVFGYRLGMIASSAGALVLSRYVGWIETYQWLAASLVLGVFAICLVPPPATPRSVAAPQHWRAWLRCFVWTPFAEFLRRPAAVWIITFIVLYKLTDAFLGMMTLPFLRAQGFTKLDIAEIVKLYGLLASIAGGFIGGIMIQRLGVWPMLRCGLFLQAGTNLLYLLLLPVYGDTHVLAWVVTIENLAGGIGTTALVAYVSGLVNRQCTATQYALLNACASMGRVWLSTPAGAVAQAWGWPLFFMISAICAVPGWWALRRLSRKCPNAGSGACP